MSIVKIILSNNAPIEVSIDIGQLNISCIWKYLGYRF